MGAKYKRWCPEPAEPVIRAAGFNRWMVDGTPVVLTENGLVCRDHILKDNCPHIEAIKGYKII